MSGTDIKQKTAMKSDDAVGTVLFGNYANIKARTRRRYIILLI